jgi:hypothetical protein
VVAKYQAELDTAGYDVEAPVNEDRPFTDGVLTGYYQVLRELRRVRPGEVPVCPSRGTIRVVSHYHDEDFVEAQVYVGDGEDTALLDALETAAATIGEQVSVYVGERGSYPRIPAEDVKLQVGHNGTPMFAPTLRAALRQLPPATAGEEKT